MATYYCHNYHTRYSFLFLDSSIKKVAVLFNATKDKRFDAKYENIQVKQIYTSCIG